MLIIEAILLIALLALIIFSSFVLEEPQSEVQRIIDDARFPSYLDGVGLPRRRRVIRSNGFDSGR